MVGQKRHEKILEKLRLDGQVQVKELAEIFGVTEDCIRKDLALLSNQKKLQRIHGGAIPLKENPHAHTASERVSLHEKEKHAIAQKALHLIRPGMTIFLDISTISLELAKLIFEEQMEVQIVTNMTAVMKVFTVPCTPQLIFLGGRFNHAKDGFTGAMTIQQIAPFRLDVAFLGAVGVDLYSGAVSTYDPEDGLTKNAVMKNARKKYLMAEKQKIRQEGDYIYGKAEDFDLWICDPALTEEEKRMAEETGFQLDEQVD